MTPVPRFYATFWSDDTPTPRYMAKNCEAITDLQDVCLLAQEPSPMAGAAEDVWLDRGSIHPIAFDCTIWKVSERYKPLCRRIGKSCPSIVHRISDLHGDFGVRTPIGAERLLHEFKNCPPILH